MKYRHDIPTPTTHNTALPKHLSLRPIKTTESLKTQPTPTPNYQPFPFHKNHTTPSPRRHTLVKLSSKFTQPTNHPTNHKHITHTYSTTHITPKQYLSPTQFLHTPNHSPKPSKLKQMEASGDLTCFSASYPIQSRPQIQTPGSTMT